MGDLNMDITERRRALTSVLLDQLMSWTHSDIRVLERALRERERSIAPATWHRRETIVEEIEDDSEDTQSDTGSVQEAYDPEPALWYYRRTREILRDMEDAGQHETHLISTNYGPLGLRGIDNRTKTVAELRTRMDELEDAMENARIDEGTYLERADALKDEYTKATQDRELLATLAAETVRLLRRVQSVPHLVTQEYGAASDAEEVD
jgi:ribosomal protein S19E (S16A)